MGISMNPFDQVRKVSLEKDDEMDVDRLMEALVPVSESSSSSKSSSSEVHEQEEIPIANDISKINDIRKTVDKIGEHNKKLEIMLQQYESATNQNEKVSLQKQISQMIQQTNTIAANGRVIHAFNFKCSFHYKHSSSTIISFLAMLLQQVFISRTFRKIIISLYAQSYSSIAHTFIEHISKYQKLQQRYASILESQYSISSFISESSTESESQQLVSFVHRL